MISRECSILRSIRDLHSFPTRRSSDVGPRDLYVSIAGSCLQSVHQSSARVRKEASRCRQWEPWSPRRGAAADLFTQLPPLEPFLSSFPLRATPSWAAGVAQDGKGFRKRLSRRRLGVQSKAHRKPKWKSWGVPLQLENCPWRNGFGVWGRPGQRGGRGGHHGSTSASLAGAAIGLAGGTE